MKIEYDEALKQISFLKEITEQSRLKIAESYPYFFLWGLIWFVGYLASIVIPGRNIGIMWLVLVIFGFIGSALIENGNGRKAGPNPTLLKKLGWLSLLMWTVAVLFFFLFFEVYRGFFKLNLINAYWPFQIGVIYLANSIFFGRQLVIVGCWLILSALVSLLIPFPFFFIWLALAGGGGLLFTGYIFRKQVLKIG